MPETPEGRLPTRPIEIKVTDRRPRLSADLTETANTPTQEKRYPSVLAELEARAQAAEAKLSEALDLLRRREAEADVFRARLRREMERHSRAQVEGFVLDLLEVVDSLDRGVAGAAAEMGPAILRDGLLRVRDQLISSLARKGVEPMHLLGSQYDPHFAEAVATCPAVGELQDNQIVEEIRRGFLFEGEVLRPAQVSVARREGGSPVEIQGDVPPKAP
jgi:molecular chaperone GrpE